MSRTTSAAESAPHSWDLEHWPTTVYPHTSGRARYLVRAHRDQLLTAGAISRIGRDIIVLGAPYTRWLASHTSRVAGYQIAANREAASAA